MNNSPETKLDSRCKHHRTWRKQTGGQLKLWATTLREAPDHKFSASSGGWWKGHKKSWGTTFNVAALCLIQFVPRGHQGNCDRIRLCWFISSSMNAISSTRRYRIWLGSYMDGSLIWDISISDTSTTCFPRGCYIWPSIARLKVI